jgi:hypothetical protein
MSAPAKALQQPKSPRAKGDIHVSSMGGDVRMVPGSGTAKGDKAIADVMREVLERVKRSIRERNGNNRPRR